ncbi:BnaCnng40980D [Brassica napus]|uniref:BnaCnng40980D protein n=1 Tax=Brassica napus TaxID=3708 RepID=A0A078JD58_BRANA|nr:BnaCnng40980D [Brassica napus]
MSSATKNDVAHAAIIEPPPDVRRMLQKTARLVSERGLKMESRVMDSNKNDERFNFLKSSDPYHAFYKHKLTQYRNNPEDGVQEILNPDAPPPATSPQFMEPLPHPFGPPEFSDDQSSL